MSDADPTAEAPAHVAPDDAPALAAPNVAPTRDAPAPPEDLAAFHACAWDVLARGAADRRSGARLVSLATLQGGAPVQRTLALRAARRDVQQVDLHTDARSAKVAQIDADPRASVLAWDADAQLQVRLTGTLSHRPASQPEWDAVPGPSREAYGHHPAPGTPIDRHDAWTVAPDRALHAVLTLTVTAMDVVDLHEPHRRALFTRGGTARRSPVRMTWLVP
ncbi:MAG: pyridoxamine 5'-phosphate oxidase family protein [Paracoccaceae bacterium]